MSTTDSPPPSYRPLPQICSETVDKYRWPAFRQIPERNQPITVKTSLDGPMQSPPPAPFLRYHRQSTYTDAYNKQKAFITHVQPMESSWINPVGKHGDFYGESTYEGNYKWQERASTMIRIPLVSTIEHGILPLVGKKGDSVEIPVVEAKHSHSDEKLQNAENTKKCDLLREHASKDFVPLQDIWSGETTYAYDYLIPPKGWKTKRLRPPSPELKFSGNMELESAGMIDYQDPKYVEKDDDFEKKFDVKNDDVQSREPFFLF